ncbi:hypothetical protein MATR_13480 [Marivirga tractuosa]|uniref:Lipoprotein n=1 Tax=Marivirga tractuosa (strain ATCC 23168 / DSM 4126 / NBRC 15989 / NCIMB 1408 / VKM B-1430 / H-43) TaxID=643867 RepID=E4TU94_MARTH|nr:hypothetical protein [Marivirga tractuosa]ADR21022.1 hypothetical protein Ftrac_1025 [Marivirga tractuosa DSM 4126]BDD14523.1 hypothetical protein MATR_13480 [Marivirga tractuosa]
MRNYAFILIVLILTGCNSKQEESTTKEFIGSVFLLKKHVNQSEYFSWQPRLNRGILKENKYYDFFNEIEHVLGYLQWNLMFEKLPDSIKYSAKSYDEVQNDFLNYVNRDEEIKRALSY